MHTATLPVHSLPRDTVRLLWAFANLMLREAERRLEQGRPQRAHDFINTATLAQRTAQGVRQPVHSLADAYQYFMRQHARCLRKQRDHDAARWLRLASYAFEFATR